MVEGSHHINYLELLPVFLSPQAFGKNWTGTTVLFCLDNVTAVTYINQKGGTTSALLCQLAPTMWTWCVSRNIVLNAEHLPGHLNTIADHKSWSIWNCCNWILNQTVFQRIREKTGSGPVCFSPGQATATILQLESRSGSSSDGCLHAGLVTTSGLCQPTLVPDPPVFLQGKNAISTSKADNSLVENPVVVSNSAGAPGGLPYNSTNPARSSSDPM